MRRPPVVNRRGAFGKSQPSIRYKLNGGSLGRIFAALEVSKPRQHLLLVHRLIVCAKERLHNSLASVASAAGQTERATLQRGVIGEMPDACRQPSNMDPRGVCHARARNFHHA